MLLVFKYCPIYDTSVARCAEWFSWFTDGFLRAVAVDDDVAADGLAGKDPGSGVVTVCHNRSRGCTGRRVTSHYGDARRRQGVYARQTSISDR